MKTSLIKNTLIVALMAAALAGTASAAPIAVPLVNGNFSGPEFSYDTTTLGNGTWTVAVGPAGTVGTIGGLTGPYMFINGGGVVYQIMPQMEGAGTILGIGDYSFTLDVGRRNDFDSSASLFDVGFYAVLPDLSSNLATLARINPGTIPTAGVWTGQALSFSITGNESWYAPGNKIMLSFSAPGAGNIQVGYDNVAGTFTAIPEPSTFLLFGLGLGALALRKRKRLVSSCNNTR